MGVLMLVGGLLAAAVASELVLNGTKLQTGLTRVLIAWTVVYVPAVLVLYTYAGVNPFCLTILWGGAFLSWFGIRSHIESSILLKMLSILRQGPISAEELIARYTGTSGLEARLEELLRGKMAERHGDGYRVTKKGQTILNVVEKLR